MKQNAEGTKQKFTAVHGALLSGLIQSGMKSAERFKLVMSTIEKPEQAKRILLWMLNVAESENRFPSIQEIRETIRKV